jgi:hypothetical protein
MAAAAAPLPCTPEPASESVRVPLRDQAQRRSSATPPGTTLTASWLVTQLLPSPELAFGGSGPLFGMRWQVTPLLYSFGIDRRLSPFRAFVVEPLVRTSGSLEWFVAPEYLALDGDLRRRFGFRTGLRAYFPLLEKGDYLSVSLGTAYARFGGQNAVAYQAGAYVLFGFLGFEQSFLPALDEARWISSLNVRFF